MAAPSTWWQNFFSGVAVDMWLKAVPPEWTRQESDFLEKTLELKPGDRLLDVPCGGGRHAIELAARGYAVTGVDLSPEFLAHARQESLKHGVAVTWKEGDMRELPWTGDFDAAYCLGNSLGYLDDAGDHAFLKAVAHALKTGGQFVLNTGTCAESFLPKMPERNWYEVADIFFLIANHHNVVESRLQTEMIFIRNGQVDRRPMSQRIYTFRELCSRLEEVGFGECRGYSSLNQEPFMLGSPQLYLVARKTGP